MTAVNAGGPSAPLSLRRAAGAMLVAVVVFAIPPAWRAAVVNTARPIAGWMWRTRLRRAMLRVVAGWHLFGAVMLCIAAPARADTSSGIPHNIVFGWMDVKDSHGISVWKYFMSIDEGSARNGSHVVYSIIINIEYEGYRALTGAAIWFIGWALSFEWMQMLVAPVRTLGEALTSMTGQLNLSTTFLTVTAAVVGLWVMRGRYSTGIYELMVSCGIAAVAVGVLSNPVETIAGTDGLIMQTRDTGLQLAAGLANEGNTDADPDQLVQSLQAELADTFVRQPTQLMNFGRVLDTEPDGARCIEAWDAGHEDAPGNTKDTLKDNVKGCGGEGAKQMKDFADHPGPGQVLAGIVLVPAGYVVLIFGAVLAGALIGAVASALVSSLKMIPGLVVGILPGAGRGSLLKDLATVLMSLTIMLFALVFVVGYMIVVRAFFNGNGDNLIQKFVFVDIILVIGIVMFRRAMKRLRKVSDALAAKMAARPGASPSGIPRSTPAASPLQSAARGVQKGQQAWRTGKKLAATSGKAASATGKGLAVGGKVAGTAALAPVAAAVATAYVVPKMVDKVKNRKGEPNAAAKELGAGETGSGDTTSSAVAEKASRAAGAVVTNRVAAPKHSATPSGMLRPGEVTKPGIKRPLNAAPPVNTGAAMGKVHAVRGSSQAGPDGAKFRSFHTDNGAALLLPERPQRRENASRLRDSQFGSAEGSTGPSSPVPTPRRPVRAAPSEVIRTHR